MSRNSVKYLIIVDFRVIMTRFCIFIKGIMGKLSIPGSGGGNAYRQFIQLIEHSVTTRLKELPNDAVKRTKAGPFQRSGEVMGLSREQVGALIALMGIGIICTVVVYLRMYS